MDRLVKGLIFDGHATVTLIDITETVNKCIEMHQLSPLASATLGRALCCGVYLANNIKGSDSKFSMTIEGGGPIGRIVVAGGFGNIIKGYVTNPSVNLPIRSDGKLDVGGAVGSDGEITVIKDLGMREPYVGKCKLKNGEIAEDFAVYLAQSEGVNNMSAFGVLVDKDGCKSAGGLVVTALPGITEEEIFIIEDIENHFGAVSAMIAEKPIEDIFNYHFGHLKSQFLKTEPIQFQPNLSAERLRAIIRSIGEKEAMSIIDEQGQIEIKYEFNNKRYVFTKPAVLDIFGKA